MRRSAVGGDHVPTIRAFFRVFFAMVQITAPGHRRSPMGDFNDEPFDASLVLHALSTRQRQRVAEGRHTPLLDLTWSLIGDPPDGTFYFNNEPNLLDQFLVNKNMVNGTRRSAPSRRR